MAKLKIWDIEVERLKKEVKELRDTLNKTSIYDEYGFVILNVVRYKRMIKEIIKRKEDLIINGPFRLDV